MIYGLYVIKDIELNSFGPIVQLPDEIILKRQISNLLKSPQNPYKNFEDKFELFKIANYNSETGIVSENIVRICSLFDLKDKSIDIGGTTDGREKI